jgi:hypothetical protein
MIKLIFKLLLVHIFTDNSSLTVTLTFIKELLYSEENCKFCAQCVCVCVCVSDWIHCEDCHAQLSMSCKKKFSNESEI